LAASRPRLMKLATFFSSSTTRMCIVKGPYHNIPPQAKMPSGEL
jgi:hypothetical protein